MKNIFKNIVFIFLLYSSNIFAIEYAYVSNYLAGTVTIIDILSNTIKKTINIGGNPQGLAVTPNGEYVYACNGSSISVINTISNEVVETITNAGPNPVSLAFTPDGAYAYITNYTNGTVTVLQISDKTLKATINVGSQPTAIAINPNGTYVYVTSSGSSQVKVIEIATNSVIGSPLIPSGNPVSIVIPSNGQYAYIVSRFNVSKVTVMSTSAPYPIIATINVSSFSQGIAITPNQNYAYVVNINNGDINVIKLSNNTLESTITTPQLPGEYIAFTSTGDYAYITNPYDNKVSILQISDNTIKNTIDVGQFPYYIIIVTPAAPPPPPPSPSKSTGSFSTTPTAFPSSYTGGGSGNIFNSSDPQNNLVISSWADTSYNPYLGIYNKITNTFTITSFAALAPSYQAGVLDIVVNAYDPVRNQVVFSWTDSSHRPWYAIYDINSNTFINGTPQQFPSYSNGVLYNVYCSYANNQFIFSWTDSNSKPWFAIYNILNQTFTTYSFASLAPSYTAGVYHDLYNCYNPINNTIVFSWADTNQIPYFGIYNFSTLTITPFSSLDPSYQNTILQDVFACIDSQNMQIYLTAVNSDGSPFFAIYNINSNSLAVKKFSDLTSFVPPASGNLFSLYNSLNNQLIMSYTDITSSHNPFLAIYDVINNALVINSIKALTSYTQGTDATTLFISYDRRMNQINFNWIDATSQHNLWYAIYNLYLTAQGSYTQLINASRLSPLKMQKRITPQKVAK
ncbi:MAG: YncE family protein [Chlamydiota bacterium]